MAMIVSASGFVVLLLLPLIPGLIELLRPKDDERLHIDSSYAREPRFFGRSFRAKIHPHVEAAGRERPYRSLVQLRRMEPFEVHDDLKVAPRSRLDGIAVALGSASVAEDARVGELYAVRSADIKERTVLRGLACDGDVVLAKGTRIERWVDADGGIIAGPRCDLGASASAANALLLLDGCTFGRLWGLPVRTKAVAAGPDEMPSIEDVVVFGERGLGLPRDCTLHQDLVVRGTLRVGARAHLQGNIKVHGDVVIGEGASIEGSVISRGNIVVGTGAAIDGNLFAEGDITLCPNARVGSAAAFKTVYAARGIRLFSDVAIHGWVVAERGGRVG